MGTRFISGARIGISSGALPQDEQTRLSRARYDERVAKPDLRATGVKHNIMLCTGLLSNGAVALHH